MLSVRRSLSSTFPRERLKVTESDSAQRRKIGRTEPSSGCHLGVRQTRELNRTQIGMKYGLEPRRAKSTWVSPLPTARQSVVYAARLQRGSR